MYGAGFKYRKLHYIQGSSAGVQTNYQIAFKVYDGTGTDSGDSIYLNNLARSGIPDIRFTTLNGTALPYWIEHPAYTGYQIVWVMLPTIPVGGTALYILYGNDSCVSASNGNLTFPFFDDFDNGTTLDIGKWTATSSQSVSNSELTLTNVAPSVLGVYSNIVYGNNCTIRIRWKPTTGSEKYSGFGFDSRQVAGSKYCTIDTAGATSDKWQTYQKNTSAVGSGQRDVITTQYYIGEISRNSSTSVISYLGSFSAYTETREMFADPINITIFDWTGSSVTDWILVRKYISPEPTHGAYLPMETSLQPLSKAYDQRGDPV